MSTGVDIGGGGRPRSSAAQTRARIFEAARIAFCQVGFDHVGVREIAARARTDAAVVIRLFGSKEALFSEVAKDAFDLDPAFQGPRETFGERAARFLLSPTKDVPEPNEFDAFQFLLRSSTSPVAAPIVAAKLHGNFVAPLAEMIGGDEAEARAALITAYVLGFTTLRFALTSTALDASPQEFLVEHLGRAIQSCID